MLVLYLTFFVRKVAKYSFNPFYAHAFVDWSSKKSKQEIRLINHKLNFIIFMKNKLIFWNSCLFGDKRSIEQYIIYTTFCGKQKKVPKIPKKVENNINGKNIKSCTKI